MPPSAATLEAAPLPARAAASAPASGRHARGRARAGVPARRLRIVDVTLFYGERGGGIRTYLDAKAAYALASGAFEHHLVVPGRPARGHESRHELRSVSVNGANGYRLPLGGGALQRTLRELAPDVVLLHDPFWAPRAVARAAHLSGAAVVAVHHASAALHAAGMPGPHDAYAGALRRWYRRAYADVDAVMSVVDPRDDCGRAATLPLRFGLDPAFRPRAGTPRGEHVLYVGRLAREKGLRELLDAAAAAPEPWPLVLRGAGQVEGALRERAQRLGLGRRVRFEPFLSDRRALARAYGEASCVVLPGPHETFGLAALEAAACGARVVTAAATPCAANLGALADTFEAGDAHDLLAALARARSRPRELADAALLATRHGWPHAMAAELADLRGLL